jgi:hypothetical protein
MTNPKMNIRIYGMSFEAVQEKPRSRKMDSKKFMEKIFKKKGGKAPL